MSTSIRELTLRALTNRTLSRYDHHRMQLILQEEGHSLDAQDRTLIQRVFYGVRHGLLNVN
ncbi:hypothetical protein VB712_01385 [Spirulina sp. CCNP1310]|uniref:hypothetical protein n=1 Tax=Spirulina sp. CCNP1310 TaxID=3110249 RepID=UPI002B1F854A|nr:hypothetical protein [Spirulina sp. CCNP1310]MEA5417856.1 hypothetical protein [Spirulina sp. CCNP1310]